MIGAIAGDIIGSVYEHHRIKTRDFLLFHPQCTFTDDTVLTVAVADAILTGRPYQESIGEIGRRYPGAGYGASFIGWLFSDHPQSYNSWGNGSAMRVSPVGFAFRTEDKVLAEAKKTAVITHNHSEGIKGAQATALALFLARSGHGKQEIRKQITRRFGYNLERTVEDIRPTYSFDISCQRTVPEAIIAFLDSESYEDAVRNAISLGGDSDTLACITGGIAEKIHRLKKPSLRHKFPCSFRHPVCSGIVLQYTKMASGLMNIFLRRKTTLNLLIIGIAIWSFDTFVHIIVYKETLLDALFLKVSGHDLYLRLAILIASCLLYLVLMTNRVIEDKESQIENILNNVIPVCITNKDYEIIMANDSYWSIWGRAENKSLKCYEHRPGESCHTENCALARVLSGAKEFVAESKKEYADETHYFIVTARPFLDSKNKLAGIIESFQDITERRKLEDEKGNLISQLQASLEKVKLLSGFIPICASCKKIRDDKGYWNQLETYIRDHSEAEFSHGICPDCARKLYPDLDKTFPKKENR